MTPRSLLALAVPLLYALRILELRIFNARKQKGTVKFVWTTVALTISGTIVYLSSAVEAYLWTFDLMVPLVIAGAALSLLRIGLKIWAARTLGRAWSAFIEVREGQRLVREGPYRFVRHPVYVSAFLEVLCIPMLANAPIAAAYAVFVHWPLVWIRTRNEERVLREQFKDQYEAYAREVPAFIPWRQGRL
jgi:protein-S-isoprenylcysteine O-methyltransferase Ste14